MPTLQGMKYTIDELEFAISQYIDGTLKPLDQAALEEVLATDQSARQILAEYRELNSALRTTLPKAEVDHDALGARMSRSLAEAEAPARHFRLAPMAITRFVAAAASVAILIGVAAFLIRGNRTTPNPNTVVVGPTNPGNGTLLVQVSSVEAPTAPAAIDISIGAPPGMASAGGWQDQAIISRTPRVVIESSALPMQDTGTPY